ncbi:gamma-glutamyltransferase [Tepidamorphus sp. 3E244]|uniref:gamma-glutamyltransferase n=1 Tax=Tepidamorphus sp. 3E244 TaxID=3385498 RepID=UPI0038FC7213
MRNFHEPRRSAVFAPRGAIATSHHLSSAAGLEVLKSGGNALDAAITAAAVQAVVEPQMTSAGGDLFAMIAFPDGRIEGFNASGKAAAAIDPEKLRADGFETIPDTHGLAITVPGGVAGWCRLLERHGTIGIDRAMAPAIDIAENGYAVSPRVAHDWPSRTAELASFEGSRAHYLKSDGTAPVAGDVMRFPALAKSLRAIADNGEAGFYAGAVADDIVATVQAAGGLMTLEDLAAVSVDPMTPVTATYRGREIVELPPNTQGFVALLMLRILEGFDMASLDPLGPERFHLEMEAANLAYAVRGVYLADADAMTTDVADLLSDATVDALRSRIDMNARIADPGTPDTSGTDTVYISCVDENRMAVSLINSIFKTFGSCIATPKTGIILQNRGAGFVLTPGHPNCIAGGKRPLHTLIPGMMKADGKVTHSFGVMGGQYQACGHAHVVTNMVDYGMDVQAAIDFPRIFMDPLGANSVLDIETTVPQTTIDGLEKRGHRWQIADGAIGGAQAIQIDRERDVLIAGSEPRKDGCALGY